MSDNWDKDIAILEITVAEKNGLQVYRNYQRSFAAHEIKEYFGKIDARETDLDRLGIVLKLIGTEEVRLLPIIICAFVDECLTTMYRRDLPDDVIGGRSSMLNGFGSLASLFQKIQFASAAQWISADILAEADALRKLRNRIAHTWNQDSIKKEIEQHIEKNMFKFEELLDETSLFELKAHVTGRPDQLFRLRTIWLTGRIFYEAEVFPAAPKRLVNNAEYYHAKHAPKLLTKIAKLCTSSSNALMAS